MGTGFYMVLNILIHDKNEGNGDILNRRPSSRTRIGDKVPGSERAVDRSTIVRVKIGCFYYTSVEW